MAEVKDDYLEQLKVEADWAGTYLSGDGSKPARRDEAQWWYDYFFGKSQSGKLGIERLQEARERLAALTSGDGSESAGLRSVQNCHAGSDGDCSWDACPQEANNRANYQTVCPLYRENDDE